MSRDTIRLERADGVATIFLDRPEKLNALNAAIRAQLLDALDKLAADDEVGAVVITGSGGRAFAAGADVSEFADRTAEEQRAVMAGRRIYDAVAEFPKPTIAAIHGFCLGGGCELALACDIRVADPTARLGQPEVRIGLIPGGGGTQRLTRLVGYGQAMRIALTGDFVDADEAHRIGLVEILVAEGEHLTEARRLAGRMLRWSPVALGLIKKSVRASLDTDLAEGLEREREYFLEAFDSPEGRAAVRAFLERAE